jgi:hypothetical protein
VVAVAAVAAPGERGRRAARLAAVALILGACGGRPGTSTVVPKPSTVPLAATSTLAPTTPSAADSPDAATPSGTLTGEERAWLDAVTRLQEKLDETWIDAAAAEPTPTAMRSYAGKLRGCRDGLARIGPPSERLQPDYRMVRDACAQFDEAARCFTAAARVGVPTGSAEQRKLEQAVDCGIEAAVDGSSLIDEAVADAEARIEDGFDELP